MATAALPFVDLTVRHSVDHWNLDLETDCGDRESLSLMLGRTGDDDRLFPLNIEQNSTVVAFNCLTTADVRSLAAALERMADLMDTQLR